MYEGKTVRVFAWMISTGVKVPYIILDWRKVNRIIALGDDFKGEWVPRIEFLVGEASHGDIAKTYGTQPLNSYLRGHFSVERGPPPWEIVVQQYFVAGCWGGHPPGVHWAGTPTVKEQFAQNAVGIPTLIELGILKNDTTVYFKDQSKVYEIGTPNEWYDKRVRGKDCLKKYYQWLPTYLRKLRREDFNVPIEEVIACIPQV